MYLIDSRFAEMFTYYIHIIDIYISIPVECILGKPINRDVSSLLLFNGYEPRMRVLSIRKNTEVRIAMPCLSQI